MHSSLRETAVPSLRDRRLKSDQESLMGYRNPNVDIVSIAGNPPDSYKITYRCRGVSDREFQISDQHTVRLEFPGNYPGGQPKFFAETPVWHPNIWSSGWFCLGDGEGVLATPISELVVKVGQMIEYKQVNPASRANVALNIAEWRSWINSHSNAIPLGETDFWDHRDGLNIDIVLKDDPISPPIDIRRRTLQQNSDRITIRRRR